MKKIALVTGSSRGIGAATVKLLAQHDYAVCINYIAEEDKALQMAADINQQGGKALAIKADISIEEDVIGLFDTIKKKFGLVTALVNNAGVNHNRDKANIEEITLENFQNTFAINVFGTFLCCREAVKHMKQAKGGSIVNVSSEAAKFGGNKIAPYASSKAAVSTLTLGFARELAPFNIRINAVSPSVINTDLFADTPPEELQNLINSLPMKRMGTPEEVAESIIWLLSDKASYFTGSIIPITGAR